MKNPSNNQKIFRKYIFWVALVGLVILSYFIIRPFVIALISAFVLAYLTRPVYKFLNERGLNRALSALACILLAILVILLPIALIVGNVVNQAVTVQKTNTGFLGNISNLPILERLNLDLQEIAQGAISFGLGYLTQAATQIPALLIAIFVAFFGMYYILIDWEILLAKLKVYIPHKDKEKTIKEISKVTKGIIYGIVLIAALQFVVTAIGFYISGVKFFLFLATIIFFLAFIPGLGAAVVWVPVALYGLFTQDYFMFIGVTITGLIASFVVDTIIGPKIMGAKTKINPLIMLVGVLGGVFVFGIFGFIIGPLILIYTLKLLEESLEN